MQEGKTKFIFQAFACITSTITIGQSESQGQAQYPHCKKWTLLLPGRDCKVTWQSSQEKGGRRIKNKGKTVGNKGPASDIVLTQFSEPNRIKNERNCLQKEMPGTAPVKNKIPHIEHV